MEKDSERRRIIVLMEHYTQDGGRLYESFRQAGFDCVGLVLEEDGFLPEGIISVYSYYLGDFAGNKGSRCMPRYYNELSVPEGWEVSGGHLDAHVHDLQEEKGKIHYAEPLYKRLVRQVDWYDGRGATRLSDHYNRYGEICARTVYDAKGRQMNRTWFSAAGAEVIVENYVTGDIMLDEGGEIRLFPDKMGFVLYFFQKTGLDRYQLCFNSLSTPYFVSQRLRAFGRRDVLFWQEPTEDEIPWNMRRILDGSANRAVKVMVQKSRSYDKLSVLCGENPTVQRLGFLYEFKKQNRHRQEALICTRSDEIEHCIEIVTALPQMHFNIVAYTEMSPELMNMAECESGNVSLYPLTWRTTVEEFLEMCDYYFDINHGLELDQVVYDAFLHNNLIFAFKETVHNRDYVAEEHIYAAEDFTRMIADVRSTVNDESALERRLKMQREEALAESVEAYQEI